MADQVMKIIIDAILALLGVLVTSGIPFLIGLLKQKLGEKKFMQIVHYASMAVQAAELIGAQAGWDSKGKKDWVLGEIERRFNIDQATLNTLIEDAVAQLKICSGELKKNGAGVVLKSAID
jgi:hypothetical protein